MIPGWPNGGTHPPVMRRVLPFGAERTRGTETSQYPEEEKAIAITRVAASETVRRPNRPPREAGVVGPTGGSSEATRSPLERGAADGDSPVAEGEGLGPVEVLSSARYEEPGAKPGGPPPKAEDSRVTDSGLVP